MFDFLFARLGLLFADFVKLAHQLAVIFAFRFTYLRLLLILCSSTFCVD